MDPYNAGMAFGVAMKLRRRVNPLVGSAPAPPEARVVFLEVLPFASRLHVLGPLLAGTDLASRDSVVVMPERATDAHWEEWCAQVPNSSRIVSVPCKAPMESSRSLTRQTVRSVVKAVESEVECDDILCITALDDWLRWSPLHLIRLSRIGRRVSRTYVVKYRLLGHQASGIQRLRILLLRGLLALVLYVIRGVLVSFDERESISQGGTVLPDPWDGGFGERELSHARETLGIRSDDKVVGLIGRQDERKGFTFAADVLIRLADVDASVSVIILGAIPSQYHQVRDRLANMLGQRLLHEQSFVSDSLLVDYFAACSAILLPYTHAFTGSSGVLARAAASGVPVVASDHGLIGYRVRSYGLGKACPYGDVDSFVTGLKEVLADKGFDARPGRAWAAKNVSSELESKFADLVRQ